MSSAPLNANLVLEPVSAPSPWQAFRLDLGPYPLAASQSATLLTLTTRLTTAIRQAQHLEPTLWLDTAELHHNGGSRLFSNNARRWSPTMGFAFDPTGPAPRTLRMSDLLDVDFGTAPKVYDRSAIFVSQLKQTLQASQLMAGRGLNVTLFFAVDAPDGPALTSAAAAFIKNSLAVLQPMMEDGAFQNYGFYLPLLSSASITRSTAAQLNTWLAGAEIYLREAFHEKELLLLSRRDLTPVFEASGMRRLSVAEGSVPWSFPLNQQLP